MNGRIEENSNLQTSLQTQKVNLVTKSLPESAVDYIFSNSFHQNGISNITDLGCAAGPNTFSVISTVGKQVVKKGLELNCQKPEMVFYLNELPGNDFNSLFGGLPKKNGEGFLRRMVKSKEISIFSWVFRGLSILNFSLETRFVLFIPPSVFTGLVRHRKGSQMGKDPK